MGEGHHDHPHQFLLQHHATAPSQSVALHSRLGGLRGRAGEIVEVQGGHIMRSTGRKDRHSKVCTAKGPRDRRVRLSAHTAIQFYDVQDRLGYDRPSKAVDWLIKNAKAAIDELAELPPWRPTVLTATSIAATASPDPSPSTYGFGSSSILPPSLDSDAIADTIKSFFPVGAAAAPTSSCYVPTEDLRLSLQSFHDPIPLHHRNQSDPTGEQAFFSSSSTPLVFDPAATAGWSDENPGMVPWAATTETGDGNGGSSGYVFNVPSQGAMPMHHVVWQSSFDAQRGPLQSSNSPLSRPWTEAINHLPHASFASFRVPVRIQGEEENDGISNLPSAASRR